MNWASIFFPLWILSPRVLLVLVFLAAGALLVAFNYSYSDGNRAGYIQKFSTKGWVCKTHEGELAMTTVPGDRAGSMGIYDLGRSVAHQLSQVMGKRVVLHYKEFRYCRPPALAIRLLCRSRRDPRVAERGATLAREHVQRGSHSQRLFLNNTSIPTPTAAMTPSTSG